MIFNLECNLDNFAHRNNVRRLILNRSCREALLHCASQFWSHLRNNSSTALTTVSAQAPKEDFNYQWRVWFLTIGKTPSKSPKATNSSHFLAIVNSIHSLSVVYVCKTPSKSPKATNSCRFLAIVNSIQSLCVVYVCMQALPERIQRCICWGSQATPEDMWSLSKAWGWRKSSPKSSCHFI
jgi:hypothetical protein